MPRFYFHLCDGTDVLLDADGREIRADMIAAVSLDEARAIIAADARNGHIFLDQTIEVHDSGGEVVHRVAFEDAVHVTHAAVAGIQVRSR